MLCSALTLPLSLSPPPCSPPGTARFAPAAAEMGEYGVAPGQRVAIVWDSSSPVEALKDLVHKVQALVGADSSVSVENVNQLSQCKNELIFSVSLKGRGFCCSVNQHLPTLGVSVQNINSTCCSCPGQNSREVMHSCFYDWFL